MKNVRKLKGTLKNSDFLGSESLNLSGRVNKRKKLRHSFESNMGIFSILYLEVFWSFLPFWTWRQEGRVGFEAQPHQNTDLFRQSHFQFVTAHSRVTSDWHFKSVWGLWSRLNVCVPLNSYFVVLIPHVTILGDRVCEAVIRSKEVVGRGPKPQGLVALLQKARDTSTFSLLARTQLADASCPARKRLLTRNWIAQHLDLGCTGLQNCEK